MSELKLENISYIYGEDTPFRKEALKNVSLCFEENKITGLIGHTGSGKSTLAEIVCGILKPTEGKVFLDGADMFKSGKATFNARSALGLVFQYPEYQLFEETVYKDIAYGPTNMKKSKEEIERLVFESAEFVGLDRELLSKSPFEISGGQKRRAAIAGILAMDPSVIVLDEPVAGLDPGGREDLLTRLKEYQQKKKKTVIIVSHSMEDMAKYADNVVIMKDGSLFFKGSVFDAFSNPEIIIDAGLDLPSVSKIMKKLSENGVIPDTSVCTVEEAKDFILRYLKGGEINAQ